MSDVTDTRCEVSKGDFAAGASAVDVSVASVSLSDSSSSSSVSSSPSSDTLGTAGAGDPALASCTVDDEDSRCRSDRDRDCERSGCESGRGVISDASSKSYTAADVLAKCTYDSSSSAAATWHVFFLPPLCPSCASSSAYRPSPPWLQGLAVWFIERR
jgi:hypothetical protein